MSFQIEFSGFDIMFNLFHDGGQYYIETSPLICGANQWTGFYMISASIMKGLKTNMTSKRQYKENKLKLKYEALLELEKRKNHLMFH